MKGKVLGGEKVEIGANVMKSKVNEQGKGDMAERKKFFDEAEIQRIVGEAAEKAKEAAEKGDLPRTQQRI